MADGDNVQPIRPGMDLKPSRVGMIRAAQANLTLATMHVIRWSEGAIDELDTVSGIMLQNAIQDVCTALGEMQAAVKPAEPVAAPHTRAMLEASVAAIKPEPPSAA